MSANNGDKSRFGAQRKRKLARRLVSRALKLKLAAERVLPAPLPVPPIA
jgi:hypothetical protein